MKTNTTDRATELRTELSSARADLTQAVERLGVAVADGNKSAAATAREDVSRAERLCDELASALPIAERRAREQAQAEAQKAQKAREKAANVARTRRISAARKVDAALLALGKAYAEYLETAPGGKPEDAARLARRSRSALAAATLNAAPDFAEALEVRRIPSMHRQTLEAAQSFVTEFKVEAEPA